MLFSPLSLLSKNCIHNKVWGYRQGNLTCGRTKNIFQENKIYLRGLIYGLLYFWPFTFDHNPCDWVLTCKDYLSWAGFFAEPNSLKIRLLNKATDNTRNYGTIMGEWFACFVPCIFSNTVKTLRSSFWGKKIRLIFLLGLQNNRRVVLHFSVIKRATH